MVAGLLKPLFKRLYAHARHQQQAAHVCRAAASVWPTTRCAERLPAFADGDDHQSAIPAASDTKAPLVVVSVGPITKHSRRRWGGGDIGWSAQNRI
jgi:hypothetical protein